MSSESAPSFSAGPGAGELETLIAASGSSRFRAPFEKFTRDAHVSASWNWGASLLGFYWFFGKRGLLAHGLAYLLAGFTVFPLMLPWPPWALAYLWMNRGLESGFLNVRSAWFLAFVAATVVVFPLYANALYYMRLRGLFRAGKLSAPADAPQDNRRRARRINAMGFAVVAAAIGVMFVLAFFAYRDIGDRSRVATVLGAAASRKAWMSEYLQTHGKLPGPGRNAALDTGVTPPELREVRIEAGGRLRFLLAGARLEGKSVVWVPVVKAGSVVKWECGGDDSMQGLLPAACRKD